MEGKIDDDFSQTNDLEMKVAILGIDAEGFLRTPLGIYLLDRADLDITRYMDELVDASPSDLEKNTELRNKIGVCLAFKGWIAEAIQSGRIAVHTMNIEDES